MEDTITTTPFAVISQLERLSQAVDVCELAAGDRESIQHKACDMATLLLDNMDLFGFERQAAEAHFERIRKRTLSSSRRKRR